MSTMKVGVTVMILSVSLSGCVVAARSGYPAYPVVADASVVVVRPYYPASGYVTYPAYPACPPRYPSYHHGYGHGRYGYRRYDD